MKFSIFQHFLLIKFPGKFIEKIRRVREIKKILEILDKLQSAVKNCKCREILDIKAQLNILKVFNFINLWG